MAEKEKAQTTEDLSYLDDFSMKGFEDISSETIAIPFLKLAQSLSPELNTRKPEYIEGLQPGDFFNSVTHEVYGDALKVNILHFEHLYTEWKPNRGGFVARWTPEEAFDLAVDRTFGAWKTKEGNDLQENYAYFIIIVGHENDGILVETLASSAIKEARKLNKMLISQMFNDGGKMAPHHQIYEMTNQFMSNDSGDWFVPGFTFAGVVQKETFIKAAEERLLIPDKTVDYGQLDGGTGTRKITGTVAEDTEDNVPY